MALRIETFDNIRGGNTLYKALTHPSAARPAQGLLGALSRHGPVAIYDPHGAAEPFETVFGLEGIDLAGVYVQQVERVGTVVLGRPAQPVTELARSPAGAVFVAAFDAERVIAQMRPYLSDGAAVFSLDALRLPADRLTNRQRYLDPLNFTTNFAFFRDTDELHTRLVTVNYWPGYGAEAVICWLTLFADSGQVLAEWCEKCETSAHAIILDSRAIRARFALPEFTGQLFLHIVGAAGHDVVKYALDTYGGGGRCGSRDRALSCTHDANAWPAERYAGLPAPGPGEQVVLWVQNSHPVSIPAGAIGLNPMGEDRFVVQLPGSVAPFATRAVDISEVLPGITWPRQIELRAGKHVVRPRYEVIAGARRRIAHVNVERADLAPNPELPAIAGMLEKGYLLPAPIMPRELWQTLVLPTPMATCQTELPIAACIYDPDGREIARHSLGRVPRAHATALDVDEVDGIHALRDGYGHIELVYDFSAGGEGDGWLHALFRYRHRHSAHSAETSFGAHIFNTLLTYRDEPQSYRGPPPGLSTRLFLRLGEGSYDTLCQLIFPASRRWLPASETDVILYDSTGCEIARSRLAIPCSGSRLWYYHTIFDPETRARAGAGAYAIIRDATCRLFGYHGLLGRGGAFSLDHMFGF